ncbi:MAG: hypothetical protein GXO44_05005 [Deferribacteres bacterium]|nr:hypothetical protein [Deferribacteres bacterium]
MKRGSIFLAALLISACAPQTKLKWEKDVYLPQTYAIKVVSSPKAENEKAHIFLESLTGALSWKQYLTLTDDGYDTLVTLEKLKMEKNGRWWVVKASFSFKEQGSSSSQTVVECRVSSKYSPSQALTICGKRLAEYWEEVVVLPEDAYSGKVDMPPVDGTEGDF